MSNAIQFQRVASALGFQVHLDATAEILTRTSTRFLIDSRTRLRNVSFSRNAYLLALKLFAERYQLVGRERIVWCPILSQAVIPLHLATDAV